MKLIKRLGFSLVFLGLSFSQAYGQSSQAQISGSQADREIRRLFEGAPEQRKFTFEGTTPRGEDCTILLSTLFESNDFMVLIVDGKIGFDPRVHILGSLTLRPTDQVLYVSNHFTTHDSQTFKKVTSTGDFDQIEFHTREDLADFDFVLTNSREPERRVRCGLQE